MPATLRDEAARSIRERRTSEVVRCAVVGAVHSALVERYDGDFSERCLQASFAIRRTLEVLGIRATPWAGDLCVVETFWNPPPEWSWGGFWDQDHHVYVVTEFVELVDLSICQLHRHGARRRPDGHAPPMVWWDDVTTPAPVLRHLPRARINHGLVGAEAEDLSELLQAVEGLVNPDALATDMPSYPGPVVSSVHDIARLAEGGDPWAIGAFTAAAHPDFAFPPWIQERDKELRLTASRRAT